MRTRSIRTVLLLGVGAVLLTGCVGYLADYHFRLTADGTPAGERSAGTTREASGTSLSGLVVELPPLDFEWFVNDYGIGVRIRNRGTTPAEVLWRDTMFLDESGTRHRTVAANDWYSRKPPLQSARIEPMRSERFDLFPEDYTDISPHSGHWVKERALFVPPGYKVGRKAEEIIALARPNAGKTLQVLMPVTFDGARVDYRFTFTITDVGARRYLEYF